MRIRGSVYLAGAITGCTYEEARYGWRKDFAEALREMGGEDVDILSPMRGKDHIEHYAGEDVITGHRSSNYVENAMSSGKGIVARDRWDTKRASVVVANLKDTPPEYVSIGTCVEFGWRDGCGPLVMIVPPDVPGKEGRQHAHDHLMLLEIADYIVHSIEEAAEVVVKLLKAGI